MDCLNPNFANEILKTTIQNSSIKKAQADKIVAQIDEIKWTGGKVNLVQTNLQDRTIYVGSGGNMKVFAFPPNKKDFETELIRAQETDRTVNVSYKTDNNNINMIISVLLYGRAAYSD